MKVNEVRKVLGKASEMNRKAGAAERAEALQKLSDFLKPYDSRTVTGFVKSHDRLKNRTSVPRTCASNEDDTYEGKRA